MTQSPITQALKSPIQLLSLNDLLIKKNPNKYLNKKSNQSIKISFVFTNGIVKLYSDCARESDSNISLEQILPID